MKKYSLKSFVCLLMAILMVVGLAACGGDPITPSEDNNAIIPDNTDDSSNGNGTTEDGPGDGGFSGDEDNVGGGDGENTPDEPIPAFTIENLKTAKIVYPNLVYAPGGKVETALDGLASTINARFSCKTYKTTDRIKDKDETTFETDYEIVVGDTRRAASSEVMTDLLQGDWGYVIHGTKIIIKGGSQEALLEAIEDFQRYVVRDFTDSVDFYNRSLDKIYRANRVGKDLKINGTPISEFTIVYPRTTNLYEQELALRLSDHIAMLSGHILPYVTDAKAQTAHEILIGQTNREFTILTTSGAALESDKDHVAIVGANAYDIGVAQQLLADLLQAAALENNALNLPDKTVATASETISMMSYNVYGFDDYQTRCTNIRRLITKYLPDIVGYQEPDKGMTDKLRMEDFYDWFDGKARHTKSDGTKVKDASGANSISPIGYAKDRYEFILGDTKWCTDTPDEASKLSSSKHYRMFTYVMLRDKVTGEEFIVMNHHLQGTDATVQLTYAFKFLQMAYKDVPIIMMGDYNSRTGTDAIDRVMIADGGFTSMHKMATNKESQSPANIDWVFGMTCCVEGTYYKWCQETYPDIQARPGDNFGDGKWPSDHRPVYVEFNFKSDRAAHTHDWSKLASEVSYKVNPTIPTRS